MILKGKCKKAALRALKENRLFWRVSDQYGYSKLIGSDGGNNEVHISRAKSQMLVLWTGV